MKLIALRVGLVNTGELEGMKLCSNSFRSGKGEQKIKKIFMNQGL